MEIKIASAGIFKTNKCDSCEHVRVCREKSTFIRAEQYAKDFVQDSIASSITIDVRCKEYLRNDRQGCYAKGGYSK